MERVKQEQLYELIANMVGVEVEEIKPESEFMADFNATYEEIGKLLTAIGERFGLDLGRVNPKSLAKVKNLIEAVEEAEL